MNIKPTTREFNGLFFACYNWWHGNTRTLRLVSPHGTSEAHALAVANMEVQRIIAMHGVR